MTTLAPEKLPSLEAPDDGSLHLIDTSTHKTLCGGPRDHDDCPAKGLKWSGERACPTCGRSVCPACLHLARVQSRTGITP